MHENTILLSLQQPFCFVLVFNLLSMSHIESEAPFGEDTWSWLYMQIRSTAVNTIPATELKKKPCIVKI